MRDSSYYLPAFTRGKDDFAPESRARIAADRGIRRWPLPLTHCGPWVCSDLIFLLGFFIFAPVGKNRRVDTCSGKQTPMLIDGLRDSRRRHGERSMGHFPQPVQPTVTTSNRRQTRAKRAKIAVQAGARVGTVDFSTNSTCKNPQAHPWTEGHGCRRIVLICSTSVRHAIASKTHENFL